MLRQCPKEYPHSVPCREPLPSELLPERCRKLPAEQPVPCGPERCFRFFGSAPESPEAEPQAGALEQFELAAGQRAEEAEFEPPGPPQAVAELELRAPQAAVPERVEREALPPRAAEFAPAEVTDSAISK